MRVNRAVSPAAAFREDPLSFMEQRLGPDVGVIRLPDRALCVTDPAAAKDIMGNTSCLYHDDSDFFHTARGVFGPRAAQIEIGRRARLLLRGHLTQTAGELARLVDRRLSPESRWPDAGNRLLYEYLKPVLLGQARPHRLHSVVDRVVTHAVLAGARERRSAIARMALRHTVMRELTAAIRSHPTTGEAEHRDLLGVLAAAAPGARPADLAEVFLSFLFATAGSIGFALGWSLYLLGTHPAAEAPPSYVVREALRMWPVAWMFARRPRVAHDLPGAHAVPGDEVVVCAYLVHRHPGHWDQPGLFLPQRWSDPAKCHAYLPFGWGPHACTGAAIATDLVEQLIHLIFSGYRLAIAGHGTRPQLGAALAPAPFTLHLTRKGGR